MDVQEIRRTLTYLIDQEDEFVQDGIAGDLWDQLAQVDARTITETLGPIVETQALFFALLSLVSENADVVEYLLLDVETWRDRLVRTWARNGLLLEVAE